MDSENAPAITSNCPKDCDKPLTVFAKVQVRPEKTDVFESWFHEISRLQCSFEGYLASELIRPTCVESDEFISIFRYDSYNHLQAWMTSDERQAMIERIPEFSDEEVHIFSYHSLEHWYVPHEGGVDGGKSTGKPVGPPAAYKMWIVTTAVIYSQTQWVPKVLHRIFPKLDPHAFEFLVVLVIVTVAQFVVFPILTRLLAFWLFPNANYLDKLRELVPRFLLNDSTTKGKTNRTVSDTVHDSDPTISRYNEEEQLPPA